MIFENTSIAITLLTTIFLVAVGWTLYAVSKKNPSMQFGELIMYVLLKRSWDVFILASMLIMVFQAMSAASIQRIGGPEINPMIRSFGHIVIGIVGYVAMTNVPVALYRIVRAFYDGKETRVIVGKSFALIGYFLIGVASPLINLFSVASSCGQHNELNILLMQWFNSSEHCREYFLAVGLDPNYSAWTEMYPILQLDTVITLVFHPIVCFFDAVNTFAQGGASLLDLVSEKLPEKKVTPQEKEAARKAAKAENADVTDDLKDRDVERTQFRDWLEQILEFYGGPFKDANKRSAKAESLSAIYQKHILADSKERKEKLISTLATLTADIKRFEAKPRPNEKAEDVKRKIAEAFRQKPAEGGFGEDLPSFR